MNAPNAVDSIEPFPSATDLSAHLDSELSATRGVDIALVMALSAVPADAALASRHNASKPTQLLSSKGISAQDAESALRAVDLGAAEKSASLKTKGFNVQLSGISGSAVGAEFRHAVQCPILRRGDQEIRLTLLRRDSAPFSGAQVAAVLRIAHAAALVLRLESRALNCEILTARVWGVVNNLPFGLALLDGSGRTVFVNDCAKALLQKRSDVALRNENVFFADQGDADWYHDCLAKFGDGAADAAQAFMTRRTAGDPPLSVVVSNLPFSSTLCPDGASSLLYVAFIEPEKTPLPDIEALRHLFGVTRTEAEIIQKVCSGMTPNDVAVNMRMSVHTVRSYLKIIFSKMDVGRQADLVRVATWTCGLLRPAHLVGIAPPRPLARRTPAAPQAHSDWSAS